MGQIVHFRVRSHACKARRNHASRAPYTYSAWQGLPYISLSPPSPYDWACLPLMLVDFDDQIRPCYGSFSHTRLISYKIVEAFIHLLQNCWKHLCWASKQTPHGPHGQKRGTAHPGQCYSPSPHGCKHVLGYSAPTCNGSLDPALGCLDGPSKEVIDDLHCLRPRWPSALADIAIIHPQFVPLTAEVRHHLQIAKVLFFGH